MTIGVGRSTVTTDAPQKAIFLKDPTDVSVELASDAGRRPSLAVKSISTVDRRDDDFATDASNDTAAASVGPPRQTLSFACDRRV
jgi:hypothetical protein